LLPIDLDNWTQITLFRHPAKMSQHTWILHQRIQLEPRFSIWLRKLAQESPQIDQNNWIQMLLCKLQTKEIMLHLTKIKNQIMILKLGTWLKLLVMVTQQVEKMHQASFRLRENPRPKQIQSHQRNWIHGFMKLSERMLIHSHNGISWMMTQDGPLVA
jgi:hypothetical protein